MKPLRLALIGSGNITRTVHLPKLATVRQIKLRACMDIVEDRARERAEQGPAVAVKKAVKGITDLMIQR